VLAPSRAHVAPSRAHMAPSSGNCTVPRAGPGPLWPAWGLASERHAACLGQTLARDVGCTGGPATKGFHTASCRFTNPMIFFFLRRQCLVVTGRWPAPRFPAHFAHFIAFHLSRGGCGRLRAAAPTAGPTIVAAVVALALYESVSFFFIFAGLFCRAGRGTVAGLVRGTRFTVSLTIATSEHCCF
jgi:hypothetical protein